MKAVWMYCFISFACLVTGNTLLAAEWVRPALPEGLTEEQKAAVTFTFDVLGMIRNEASGELISQRADRAAIELGDDSKLPALLVQFAGFLEEERFPRARILLEGDLADSLRAADVLSVVDDELTEIHRNRRDRYVREIGAVLDRAAEAVGRGDAEVALAALEKGLQQHGAEEPVLLVVREYIKKHERFLDDRRVNQAMASFRERLLFWRNVAGSDEPADLLIFARNFDNGAYRRPAIAEYVRTVRTGKHGKLPSGNTVSVSSERGYGVSNIHNDTRHELTVAYDGPEPVVVTFKPDEKASVELLDGEYEVAAHVDAPNVIPFAGELQVEGHNRESKFYIRTTSSFTPPVINIPQFSIGETPEFKQWRPVKHRVGAVYSLRSGDPFWFAREPRPLPLARTLYRVKHGNAVTRNFESLEITTAAVEDALKDPYRPNAVSNSEADLKLPLPGALQNPQDGGFVAVEIYLTNNSTSALTLEGNQFRLDRDEGQDKEAPLELLPVAVFEPVLADAGTQTMGRGLVERRTEIEERLGRRLGLAYRKPSETAPLRAVWKVPPRRKVRVEIVYLAPDVMDRMSAPLGHWKPVFLAEPRFTTNARRGPLEPVKIPEPKTEKKVSDEPVTRPFGISPGLQSKMFSTESDGKSRLDELLEDVRKAIQRKDPSKALAALVKMREIDPESSQVREAARLLRNL